MQEDTMAVLKRPDGEIHYQTFGNGFPVLLFAPGGLRSRMEMWPSPPGGPARPWVDWTTALPEAGFTAVAMDQRNAGASRTAIEADHGWHTYAADHIALMDHLGFDKFHVLGGCIGGSFCLKAVETAPKRVLSAGLQNPIGLHRRQFLPEGGGNGAKAGAVSGAAESDRAASGAPGVFSGQSCGMDEGAACGAAGAGRGGDRGVRTQYVGPSFRVLRGQRLCA